jgi:hypothetical protein
MHWQRWAGLECAAVDAEFRGEEWLGPDDLFHLARARSEGKTRLPK